jgi:ribosomal protein S18 acetylase RimI-like enzyme
VQPAASPLHGDVEARARAWRDRARAAVCDVLEPWAHGTIVRATRYPSAFDLNVVRVEEDPQMSVKELLGVADRALAGLAHRRVDFDLVEVAEARRAGFEAQGWAATRLLWMHHDAPAPRGPDVAVEEVPYDAVCDLRVAWMREDFPDQDPADYLVQAREVAERRATQVLAVCEGGVAVAFAQLERDGPAAEITQIYVHPDHRGRRRGTAMTLAAIEAAGHVRDLWIVADDDGRPKQLYARLGFRPAWTSMEFLLPPAPPVAS